MAMDLMKGDLVRHAEHGPGRVEQTAGYGDGQTCEVWFPRRGLRLTVRRQEITPFAAVESEAYEMVLLALAEREQGEAPPVQIGPRWEKGELVIRPGDPELTAKSIPLEAFFHKVVMVRDRLRVLEQQINAHKRLSDAEKVDLQQYITRVYGSLTTFNFLFREKSDWFVGQKGERE